MQPIYQPIPQPPVDYSNKHTNMQHKIRTDEPFRKCPKGLMGYSDGYIIKAANNHKALVGALRYLINEIELYKKCNQIETGVNFETGFNKCKEALSNIERGE